MTTVYRYTDWFTGQVKSCRCTVIGESAATVTIRLDEFGPKGRPPGTVMRVRRKSVRYPRTVGEASLSWHEWTD